MCELCEILEVTGIDEAQKPKLEPDGKGDLFAYMAEGFKILGKAMPSYDDAEEFMTLKENPSQNDRVYYALIKFHYESTKEFLKKLLKLFKEEYPDDYEQFISYGRLLGASELLVSMGLID